MTRIYNSGFALVGRKRLKTDNCGEDQLSDRAEPRAAKKANI
jgi:hypothetical protein